MYSYQHSFACLVDNLCKKKTPQSTSYLNYTCYNLPIWKDPAFLRICRRDTGCKKKYLLLSMLLTTFPWDTEYKCLHSTLPILSSMSPHGTAHTYPACLALVLWHRCQQGILRRMCLHLPSRGVCQMDTSNNKKQHCWSFGMGGRHTVCRARC